MSVITTIDTKVLIDGKSQTIKSKGVLVGNKREGIWTYYDVNGKVSSRMYYRNDTINGISQTFYENGQLQESGVWSGQNKRWIGEYTMYWKNGNKRQSFTYDSDGKRIGTNKIYHPNGILCFIQLLPSLDSIRFDTLGNILPHSKINSIDTTTVLIIKEIANSENKVVIRKKALLQAQIRNQIQQNEINKQEEIRKLEIVIRYTFIIVIIIVSSLVFIIYKRFKLANDQKILIENQKLELENKTKDISDSIYAAKRLQVAIHPEENVIKGLFPDMFILYLPKDIVSGDFIWFKSEANFIYFAVADCTGHGVSGAMMSLLCSNILDRVINDYGVVQPGQLLDKATILIDEALNKNGSDIKDGMDISLFCIDTLKNKILWSGALNPLWILKNEKLQIIPATRQSIGRHENKMNFETHEFEIQNGMEVFLFTDGYADQFGGPKEKKFMTKRLQQLITDNRHLSMNEKKHSLEKAHHTWKGCLEQVDDITIVGLKLLSYKLSS